MPSYRIPTRKAPKWGGAAAVPKGPRWLRSPQVEEQPPWIKTYPGAPYSLPEWAVQWALQALGYKLNEDFAYTYELAPGRGLELDFYIFAANIGIDVQGVFIHYEKGSEKILYDLNKKSILESQFHILVIFIDEDDAVRDPMYFVKNALEGRDLSRIGRGEVIS